MKTGVVASATQIVVSRTTALELPASFDYINPFFVVNWMLILEKNDSFAYRSQTFPISKYTPK